MRIFRTTYAKGLAPLIYLNFLVSQVVIAEPIDISGFDPVEAEKRLAAAKVISEEMALSGLGGSDSHTESLVETTDDKKSDINLSLDGIKFGYGFFSKIPTSISATGDLPLPNDYKISLKDRFTIILSGSKDSVFDLAVRLNGTITFPEIGSISVAGLTLSQARNKISSLVQKSYVGVEVDVSIKDLSGKKITIVGAVNQPGTYLVNPFSTITASLAYSGGVSELGSLREIKLIKPDGKEYIFDLYDLLIRGDRSNDLTIDAGDTILVGPAKSFVRLSGSVIRPAIYEIKEGEDLKDLIDFGLGFRNTSNKKNISYTYLDLKEMRIKQEEFDSLSSSLNNVLNVDVFDLGQNLEKGVLVSGPIGKPGYYDYKEFPNLNKLIEEITFLNGMYPFLAILQKANKAYLFNPNQSSTYLDLALEKNDRVFFLPSDGSAPVGINNSTRDLLDAFTLRISGIKGKAFINMPVIGKYNLQELMDYKGVDLSDYEVTKTVYISPLENVSLIGDYRDFNFDARKFAEIIFRPVSTDLIDIEVSGQVDTPGIYTVLPGTTLESIYKMLGSFKPSANKKDIIVLRESLREKQVSALERAKTELIDLYTYNQASKPPGSSSGEFLSFFLSREVDASLLGRIAGDLGVGSVSSKSLILEAGDKIIIPSKSSTVSILGEVSYPLTTTYQKNLSLKSYIEKGGGYRDLADRRSVYVISSNGEIKLDNRWLGGVRISPGDTIVVPRRVPKGYANLPLITSITTIISNLAFAAASLEALQNN